MTGGTLILQSDLKLFITSKYSVLKGDVHTRTQIGTFHRAIVGTSAASAASEQISENISENVTHIRTGEIKASEASCSATASVFKSSVTKLVVLSSLVRVT